MMPQPPERPISTSQPILVTKLGAPPIPPGLVIRRRLIERLDAGLAGKLTLVTAPPGFGKTTLLSDWARGRARPVAWLSLDPGDNDPARFWSYVIHALSRIYPSIGDHLLDLIGPSLVPSRDALLVQLINALAAAPTETILVLDDYQVIESAPIHDALGSIIEHLPPTAHLVIVSRADPPFPLGRLRARGQLTELRDADLRFTPQEAALFLREAMGLILSPDDITALENRTEGWIAGLQLAALSLRGHDRPSEFVRAFAGNHRYVFDYLLEEVLNRQPPETESFLLETSILDRLSGSLCNAVTQRTDSQEQLERLDRDHLFVSPLDEEHQWYRYHRLFADVLRHRLNRQQPGQERTLHSRAAEWYEQADLLPEAVGHALAAGDVTWAASLIERSVGALWRQGEVVTILRWLDALPPEVVRSRPRLLIASAWVEFLADHFERVERLLHDAEEVAATGDELADMPGVMDAMRSALLSMREDDPARVVALAKSALAALPEPYTFWRRVSLIAMGLAYDALGESTLAAAALSQALESGLHVGDSSLAGLAVWNLLRVEGARGTLKDGIQRGEEVLRHAEERSWPASDRGDVLLALGSLTYEVDDLERASRQLEAGIDAVRKGGLPRPLLGGYLALARLRSSEGNTQEAWNLIEQAEEVARRHRITGRFARVGPVRVRLALAGGDLEEARHWAEAGMAETTEEGTDRERAELAMARLLIAEHHASEALALLQSAREAAERQERAGSLIEILTLTALAHHVAGERRDAVALLTEALELAAPRGYIRTIVDEGEPIGDLLAAIPASDAIPRDYLTRLHDAQRRPAPEVSQAPAVAAVRQPSIPTPRLSGRELEVLRLVASGASNRAIANQLFITLPTVKKHVANLLDKLDAANRTEAVARARELDLI